MITPEPNAPLSPTVSRICTTAGITAETTLATELFGLPEALS
jgi:hypothetical protein